jgi:hypothetical protein
MTWVSGVIESAEKCLVGRVAQVELLSIPNGRALPFVAELLNGEGERVASATLRSAAQLGCGSAEDSSDQGGDVSSVHFDAYLPVLPKAARLRIRRGDTVLWERTRPTMRPSVELTRSSVGRDGELHLRWRSKVDGSSDPEVWVQWRRDETAQWHALRVEVRESEVRIPLDSFPAGRVRVRVLLHDGFSTASTESGVLKIPARGPAVGIINPTEGASVSAGATMLLWGYASDCHGKTLPDESFTWRLNGKAIGTGRTLPVVVPMKGSRYRIELEVQDEHGTARAISRVSAVAPSRTPPPASPRPS